MEILLGMILGAFFVVFIVFLTRVDLPLSKGFCKETGKKSIEMAKQYFESTKKTWEGLPLIAKTFIGAVGACISFISFFALVIFLMDRFLETPWLYGPILGTLILWVIIYFNARDED